MTLSLADAKTALNLPAGPSQDDAEITGMIADAQAAIVARVGEMDAVTVTDRIPGGHSQLLLRRGPVLTLTSITPISQAPLTVTDYQADGRVIRFSLNPTYPFPMYFYDVVYQAGRNPIPTDLLQAVKLLLIHMWQTQRGGAVRRQAGQDLAPNTAYAMPYRVQELIEPYLQDGFA